MIEYGQGSLFGGRYEVIRCIGAGGMGAVYLASDPRYDDFAVALKVLYPGIVRTPELRDRFRTEIVASYRVQHRNVVRAYEYFDEENLQAYVMEYVEGIDLHDKIKDEKISVEEGISILCQAAGGLHAIHSEGIVHRDLKPENILVTAKGRVKIADFGVARLKSARSSVTQVGAMVGTPKYFAPEYIEVGECDHRGDLYALGVIGYELLTGVSPFRSETHTSMMVERFQSKIKTIKEVLPKTSPELSRVISKAMALSISQRYQSAEEMRIDLEMLQKGKPLVYAVDEVSIDRSDLPAEDGSIAVPMIESGICRRKVVPKDRSGSDSTKSNFLAFMAASILLVLLTSAAGIYVFVSNPDPLHKYKQLTEGEYRGFVAGLEKEGSQNEIRFFRFNGVTEVVLGGGLCLKVPVGDNGVFRCGDSEYQLMIDLLDGTTCAGTVENLPAGPKGKWSMVKLR